MPITFTIILPEGEGELKASLIAKRGNYAHMDSFSYTEANLMTAMQVAVGELDLLERIPPQIELPANPSPSPSSKDKNPKATKPKKKKVSLDDIPDEDGDWSDTYAEEIEVEDLPETEPLSPQSVQTTASLKATASVQVGAAVNLETGAVDVDGDPIPFRTGRILEIELDAEVPRVWVESSDGEADAWLKLADLEAKPQVPRNLLQCLCQMPLGN